MEKMKVYRMDVLKEMFSSGERVEFSLEPWVEDIASDPLSFIEEARYDEGKEYFVPDGFYVGKDLYGNTTLFDKRDAPMSIVADDEGFPCTKYFSFPYQRLTPVAEDAQKDSKSN